MKSRVSAHTHKPNRTPFGAYLQQLRAERGMSLADLAARLAVSPAYLSALETGARGVPNRRFLHQICQIFAIIWDEADALNELAKQSNPRPVLDVRGTSASHIRLANILAAKIPLMEEGEVAMWLNQLEKHSLKGRDQDQDPPTIGSQSGRVVAEIDQ